jgi:hypothetical protein
MRIDLHVWRDQETHNSVGGQLWYQGMFACYTLEPSRMTPVRPGHPCIPAGTYRARLTRSPHLGYICPELIDVPERSDIRIHVANWPMQLLGCTALGHRRSLDLVELSGVAFHSLMKVLANYQELFVTYHDGPPPPAHELIPDKVTVV